LVLFYCGHVGNASCVVHMSTGLRLPEHLAWGAVVQRLVWALVIVEHEPRADTATCLGNRTIRLDEHFFVLQAAPQPFNEDVVEEPALAIHAHAHTMTFQVIEKRSTGELYALIGVEHLRLAKALHRLLQRFHTEIGVHTNRQLPSQHPAAEPIHHSHQIDESLGKGTRISREKSAGKHRILSSATAM